MKNSDCIGFLKWSLPRFRMRWQGFRKVRGQVCKRIGRRLGDLGLTDVSDYRSLLERQPEEWTVLDGLLRVTISRFYRDRKVFEFLEREVLVNLCEAAQARGEKELRCWSIGCASGEEPYTLAILGNRIIESRFRSFEINVLATDAEENMIGRAEKGCYSPESLRELPRELRDSAFDHRESLFCIKTRQREKVRFLVQDVRENTADDLFHLIFCRNLAFTYFDAGLQQEVLARVGERLRPGGALVIGVHESLPAGYRGFAPWPGSPCVYRKTPGG